MRIVSLLPSATEMICGIGLQKQLVGVSHECDYPLGINGIPRVTRTCVPHDSGSSQIDAIVRDRIKSGRALYSIEQAVLHAARPDLIVTQSLCDVCAVSEHEIASAVDALPNQPVVVNLEPSCLEDVYDCILRVGSAADVSDAADKFVDRLRTRVSAVESKTRSIKRRPSVILLEWIDPPFSAGHWTPELVAIAGGSECIGKAGARSASVSWETIRDANPEILVVACCGFETDRAVKDLTILQRCSGWDSMRCVQAGQVYVVDGSAYFNRPGPRLVESLEILASLIQPGVIPWPAGVAPSYRLMGR